MSNLFWIAWSDAHTHKINNSKVAGLATAVLLYVLQEESLMLTDKIIGILIISMPMLVFTLLLPGSFGGGDIKLMSVCGLLLGGSGILRAAWITLLSAAVYAVRTWVLKKSRKAEVALGPFICFGVLCVYLNIL